MDGVETFAALSRYGLPGVLADKRPIFIVDNGEESSGERYKHWGKIAQLRYKSSRNALPPLAPPLPFRTPSPESPRNGPLAENRRREIPAGELVFENLVSVGPFMAGLELSAIPSPSPRRRSMGVKGPPPTHGCGGIMRPGPHTERRGRGGVAAALPRAILEPELSPEEVGVSLLKRSPCA